jgi:hypothetical protein
MADIENAIQINAMKVVNNEVTKWNTSTEQLIKAWGEKAGGLRLMHMEASNDWKTYSDRLTILSIILTALASSASLISGSLGEIINKDIIAYVVGGIGIFSGFLQSIKKYYNADQQAANHLAVSKQFGAYNRNISLQLSLTRIHRTPPTQFIDYALKEYEKLQQDAPPLSNFQIKKFQKEHNETNTSAIPDVCKKDLAITVNE